MQQHKHILCRNGITSGLKSDAIRFWLLEFEDSEASLENCISLVNEMEVSVHFSRSFNATSDTPISTSNAPVGNIAAFNKRTAQTNKASNSKAGFCCLGLLQTKYPAGRITFLKCGKKMALCSSLLQVLLRNTTNN